jgi:hypothetical protein
MKFQLLVRAEAEKELTDACDFYDSEQVGLGDRLHEEVAKTLRAVEENPFLYPHAEKTGYRKAVLHTFPFSIYYCVTNNRVIVIAVHDARRDPMRWQERAR